MAIENLQIESATSSTNSEGFFAEAERISFPILLFILAFFPRAIDLVARSTLWHRRAESFLEAIGAGKWGETLLAPHPGVVTMWLAGIANVLNQAWSADYNEQSQADRMSVEMLPLALLIALAIVLTYFLLTKLFGRPEAMVATLLLALDPFHIFISKTLHVDGPMSALAMISALAMLLYTGRSKGGAGYLMLAGLGGGLALLSKVPSLFLFPYFLLCLGARELQRWLDERGKGLTVNWRRLWRTVVEIAKPFLLWIIIVAFIYFLLYPAMWVRPTAAFERTFRRTVTHTTSPHIYSRLFMGEATLEDPGPLFYPVNIAIKTTMVTLPGFALGIAALFSRRLSRQQRWTILLMIAFAVFFTIQMTIGQKKSARYILPAFQFITLVAGIGIVTVVRWLAGNHRRWQNVTLIGVIGLQAAIALPRHPYYGTHFNALIGGPQAVLNSYLVAGQEQGEGLEMAADYLNDLPNAPLLSVAVKINDVFGRYFNGRITSSSDPDADYVIFERNTLAREATAKEHWESYQDRKPKLVVSFDDIPYVWVYRAGPQIADADIPHPMRANLGETIQLLGYEVEPMEVRPGETIHLTLFWEALTEPKDDYTVFTHLLDADGQLQAQKDSQPQGGMYPTYLWDAGERVRDEYELVVPDDAPPGVYQIAVGMYQLTTLERLPATTEDGPLRDNRVLLSKLTILPSEN